MPRVICVVGLSALKILDNDDDDDDDDSIGLR